MARLFTEGFELNSGTASYGWNTVNGVPTISTTTVRSGTYSGRISGLTSGAARGFIRNFAGAGSTAGPIFCRAYLNIATLPSAANQIMQIRTNGGTMMIAIDLNADGTLQLRDEDGTIGSVSAALSTGTFYRIELQYDRAVGANKAEALIDGSVFATANNRAFSSACNNWRIGGNCAAEAQTQGDWFWDDCAINDNVAGGGQTSYPGSEKVIRLTPSAAGDSSQWVPNAGTNFSRVSEVTPDDATTFVSSATLNDSDLYNCTDSGIGATDTVNVVEVHARFRNGTADATTAVKFQIEKTSGGTKTQSAAITPNTTTWGYNTSAGVTPRLAPLVTYLDPDGAAWTQATLDSMQIGQQLTLLGVNAVQVTWVAAIVGYTPAAVVATKQLAALGVG